VPSADVRHHMHECDERCAAQGVCGFGAAVRPCEYYRYVCGCTGVNCRLPSWSHTRLRCRGCTWTFDAVVLLSAVAMLGRHAAAPSSRPRVSPLLSVPTVCFYETWWSSFACRGGSNDACGWICGIRPADHSGVGQTVSNTHDMRTQHIACTGVCTGAPLELRVVFWVPLPTENRRFAHVSNRLLRR
jgi:hypothetical protein